MRSPRAQPVRWRSSRAFERTIAKITSSSGSPTMIPIAAAAIETPATTTVKARIDAGSELT